MTVVKNQAPITQSTVTPTIVKQTTEPARDQKYLGELKSIIKNYKTENQSQHEKSKTDHFQQDKIKTYQTYEPPRVVTTTTLIEGCRDRKLTGSILKLMSTDQKFQVLYQLNQLDPA